MSVPRHAKAQVRRFRTRPAQVVQALLLPEHPKLNVVDWNAIIVGLGIDQATVIAEQLASLDLHPWPDTWLILEGGDVVGWASSMDDMEPLT